jgi:hypothetical protein
LNEPFSFELIDILADGGNAYIEFPRNFRDCQFALAGKQPQYSFSVFSQNGLLINDFMFHDSDSLTFNAMLFSFYIIRNMALCLSGLVRYHQPSFLNDFLNSLLNYFKNLIKVKKKMIK